MKFEKFRIQNYKGIQDTEISLDSGLGARIVTLVGLNEGGKTTLLEAIHSFSPDADTQVVVGNVSSTDEQRRQRVPRHRISDFSGEVSVTATLTFEDGDKVVFKETLAGKNIDIDIQNLPETFTYERLQRYKNGDFVGSFYRTNLSYSVKTKRQKKFREPTHEEGVEINNLLQTYFPVIAYFPTFVFDFPEKIYLTDRQSSKTNAYYKKLFQDILDFDGRGQTINEHIVSRIRKPELELVWHAFFPKFQRSNESDKIDHVMARAAQTVTQVVFKKWNEIFNEVTAGKEIDIDWQLEEGPLIEGEEGEEEENLNHDIYVRFRVKHGTQKYDIKDRSLGFRWFFTFLLFTQFRVARDNGRAIVFLFDEPASNLHASAQQKLVDSFSQIAKPPHTFIYSTHSHYMIEPKWLEQAYIVQNEGTSADSNMISSAIVDDETINVRATPYRRFVSENASNISYFQPIMDRLDVVPSKFDIEKGGVIVEGKSDYYILKYISDVHLKKKARFFPGLGAGTFNALIALNKGWGLPVRLLLDSDAAGKKEKINYQERFYLNDNEVACIGDFCSGASEIEKLLSPEDRKMILSNFPAKKKLLKKDILLFFQENLAAKKKIKLSKEFTTKSRQLLTGIIKYLG